MQGRLWAVAAALAGAAVVGGIAAVSQAQAPVAAAAFTADGRMEFPRDYRTWVYLSSGVDMVYTEGGGGQAHAFDNVFVDPAAYRAFQQTGTWPDGAVLVLEIRGAEEHASINRGGRSQTDRRAVEVHVKDAARFAGGWGFFGFSGERPATLMPQAAACYACHQGHGAVDTTFVQFYPTLMPLARSRATLSAAYLAAEKAQPGIK